jgi:hypothetical protein
MAAKVTFAIEKWLFQQFLKKTQYPRSFQGKYRQFADRRDDSMRTMIVDKFYHFHHHR